MAKVTMPLGSFEASGTIAKALVFAKWKGQSYVRRWTIPRNPRSALQQAVRAALGAAGRFNSFIQMDSDAQVAVNDKAPSGQSGASYFARLQSQRFVQSELDYEDEANSTEAGYFDSAASTLGLLPVTIPGDTPVVVPGGLILWNAYDSMNFVDDTLAPTRAVDASSGNITTFLGSLA